MRRSDRRGRRGKEPTDHRARRQHTNRGHAQPNSRYEHVGQAFPALARNLLSHVKTRTE